MDTSESYLSSNRQLIALLPSVLAIILSSNLLSGVWPFLYIIFLLFTVSFLYTNIVERFVIGKLKFSFFLPMVWVFQITAGLTLFILFGEGE